MFDKDYRVRIIDREQLAGSHHTIPVDDQDPLFHEPLVRIEPLGIAFKSWHAVKDGSNAPYFSPIEGSHQEGWLRQSVAERLVRVNRHLRPYGAELFILDAYRSLDCQKGLWKFFYERGKQENPWGGDQAWTKYALGYVRDPRDFDPLDSRTFPAHITGASVDVTLRYIDSGEILNMGSKFEEIIPVSYTDYFERQLDKGLIAPDDERLLNRRLMDWAFNQEGFLNDPILYWHYDWGNQLYVKVKRAINDAPPAAAWYGYVPDPDWETESFAATTLEEA